MVKNITRSKLIQSMTAEELMGLLKLLEDRITGHTYDVDKSTTFRTPVKKIITITLNTTASRLLIESATELRDREKIKAKKP